jgi:hypothetical protein
MIAAWRAMVGPACGNSRLAKGASCLQAFQLRNPPGMPPTGRGAPPDCVG